MATGHKGSYDRGDERDIAVALEHRYRDAHLKPPLRRREQPPDAASGIRCIVVGGITRKCALAHQISVEWFGSVDQLRIISLPLPYPLHW